MSHEVETMFSARLTPWHELGVITDRELTAAEALTTAELDWEVSKEPIYALTPSGFAEIPDRRATVRSKDNSVLGVVGDTYEVIQNKRMFNWVETLLETGEAKFTTAGSLRGGRIVFACLDLGREIQLGGTDAVYPYFVIASSHDGSTAFKAFKSNIRVVCKNTLDFAMEAQKTKWTIRHTTTADFRLEAARRMLGLVIASNDEFSQLAHQLIDETVSSDKWDSAVERSFFPMPKNASPRTEDGVKVRRAKLHQIYSSPTIGAFRGTAWGALNAVNEYEIWSQRVTGRRAERHALRALNNDFPLTEKARKVFAAV